MRWFLAWLVVVGGLAATRQARADDEPVIVVDVTPSASALDADRLRTLIAGELHAETVKPDDRRAASAKGTVTIDVDRKNGDLSVTYLARTAPTTRHVPLPADGDAARSTAVSLAGNLARDEASELAAELREQHARRAGGAAPKPSAEENAAASGAEKGEGDARQLQAMALYFAQRESHSRRVVGWTSVIAGAAAVGVGFGTLALENDQLGWMSGAGVGLMAFGFTEFLQPAPLDARQADGLFSIEDWVKAAREEHVKRRGFGVARLIVSLGMLGFGTYVLLSSDHAASRGSFGAGGLAFGAFGALEAVHDLTTDGPIEAALRAHEQSTGRVLWPKEAARGRFHVGIVPGGAMGSFAATF